MATFLDAVARCHVRSAIRRKAKPDVKYWNNSIRQFRDVPMEDRVCDDWEEYDPRDHEECSEFNELPA